ncbi:MAG: PD-(D/E)XK nuclease family protein, partial [Deltaproteobacteria bacterium]
FELPYERKERTRQLLRYLASCSRRLWVSYVGKCPLLLSEFLVEYPKASFERNVIPRAKPEESRRDPSGSFATLRTLRMTYENLPLPHSYSVRSLNQYQRCPYGFFIRECLGLYPKSLNLQGLNSAEEGIIYHDILFRFFSPERGGSTELADVFRESFEILSNKIGHQIPLSQRLRIEKTVSLFLEKEKEWRHISRFKPRYFEQSFEMELKQGDESIPIRGKIDRVDVDEERKEFITIDYKTGGDLPSAKEVMAGRDFQLVIYAMAMEELFLRGYRPTSGFCYQVKKIKSKKLFEVLSGDEWGALKKRTLNEVFSIVSEIRKKRFFGTPENCYEGCELRGVCGNDQLSILA